MYKRFIKNKKLLLNYYFTAFVITILVGLWTIYGQVNETGLLIFLAIYTYIFPITFLFMRRYAFQLFVFILAMITGVYSFYHYSIDNHSFLNALYFTFQLFLLMTEDVFTEEGASFIQYPVVVEVARWSAASYTISTVFITIYHVLETSIRLTKYQFFGGHTVIIGFNKYSKLLIEDLCNKDQPVVLLTEAIPIEQQQYLEEMGVVVVVGKIGDHKNYHKCRVEKAKRLLLFHMEDSENLDELISLKEYFSTFRKEDYYPDLLLHLTNDQSYAFVNRYEEELKSEQQHFPFAVQIVNMYKLLAEKLLANHPLYIGYENRLRKEHADSLHVLVIGFGRLGQHIVLQAMEQAHFFGQSKLKITILDKNIHRLKRHWFRNYPKSDYVAQLYFEYYDNEIESLKVFLEKQDESYTHIYLCLHDDYTDVMEGIELSKQYPEIPIFMKFKRDGAISKWIESETNESHKLYGINTFDEVLNEQYFINEQLISLASVVHDDYQATYAWKELTQVEKEAHYNQLIHAQTKLMLAHLDIVPKGQHDTDALTRQEFQDWIANTIEQLAAAEHQRWCTFYFLKGWDVLEEGPEDILEDTERRLHRCLVPYNQLDEDRKQSVRNIIYELYTIWDLSGYDIIPTNND